MEQVNKVATSNANESENAAKVASVELKEDKNMKDSGTIMNMEDKGIKHMVNPEKPDVPLNKNDAFQKVQKRRVQEKR